MKAGRVDGFGRVYDARGKPLLYQEEYIVQQNRGFVSSDAPDAPLSLMEGDMYLTNWRLLVLGPVKQEFVTDEVSTEGYHSARFRPDLSKPACDYLELYLDEVRNAKRSILGDLKLFVPRGCVDVSGTSKEFKGELLKAVEWYLRSRR